MEYVILFAFLIALAALMRSAKDHKDFKDKISYYEREIALAKELINNRARVASEVAHEIKNPITAILCSVETLNLLLENDISSEHKKTLEAIHDFGETILQLVGDFIDISRLDGNLVQCKKEVINLESSVIRVIELLQASANRKQVTIKCDYIAGVYLLADGKHLRQILFNIIHNAIKFSRVHGVVSITFDGEGVVIADSGSDLSSPTLDPFSLGLGLAISKALIDLNGGKLQSVSAHPGTKVYLKFPLAKTPAHLSYNVLDTERVLILKDSDETRPAVTDLIAGFGSIVKEVTQISEALNELHREAYQTVIINGDPRKPNLDPVIAYAISKGSKIVFDEDIPPLISLDSLRSK
jgi:signal transduction histidine kinase